MPQWIYIAGRGHSGSTMLDAMLGNVEGVESVGELVSGMGRYDDLCSCGETFTACPYWREVRRRFTDDTGRTWDEAVMVTRKQAHISAFPATLFGRRRTRWVSELTQVSNGIARAVAEADDGAHFIVDSSKEITRALFFLKFVSGSKVIHLMRHPAAILQSDYYRLQGGAGFRLLRRSFSPRRFFGVILCMRVVAWIVGNLLADLTRQFARDRFLRVRYEDFIMDPDVTLARIETFLGTSLAEIRNRISRRDEFIVGHNIGGNQMRHAGRFVFDPRKSSRSGLPVRYIVMTWLMTWPLLIAYGYRGRPLPGSRSDHAGGSASSS